MHGSSADQESLPNQVVLQDMDVTGIVWIAGAAVAVTALARLASARRAQLVKELRRQVGKKIPSESLSGDSDEETA